MEKGPQTPQRRSKIRYIAMLVFWVFVLFGEENRHTRKQKADEGGTGLLFSCRCVPVFPPAHHSLCISYATALASASKKYKTNDKPGPQDALNKAPDTKDEISLRLSFVVFVERVLGAAGKRRGREIDMQKNPPINPGATLRSPGL